MENKESIIEKNRGINVKDRGLGRNVSHGRRAQTFGPIITLIPLTEETYCPTDATAADAAPLIYTYVFIHAHLSFLHSCDAPSLSVDRIL